MIDPFEHFAAVYAEALTAGVPEPSAFCLATVDDEGRPAARMLLLKGVDARGFTFFTNLSSRKATHLAWNPNAAMCFFWQQIGRQVRIEGIVVPVSDDEADEYFATRARGSKIGAWASLQSSQLNDKAELLSRVAEIEARFPHGEIPRPPYWSGYCLRPRRIEFWTAGEFRLHDRQVYETDDDTTWRTHRLYP